MLFDIALDGIVVGLQAVYEEGGIYFDLDGVPLRPFTELLSGKYQAVFGKQIDGW